MLQLARGGVYAIRAVLFLASKPDGELSVINEISEAQDIPGSYLAKIMQELARAGHVRSRRGPKGGYALERGARHITMLEIVEAVDGPINLSSCLIEAIKCRRYETCPVHPVLNEAGRKLIEVLAGTTVADLIRGVNILHRTPKSGKKKQTNFCRKNCT